MEINRLIVGPLFTNCYILKSGNETAVIDPGGDPEKIQTMLRQIEGELKYIILTHYHFDHIFSVNDIRKGKVKILIHENEKKFINFPVDGFLKNDDKIALGQEELKVISTPGHSKGGICLLGDNFILTGDTLFADGYGRTDLDGGSEEDMKRSLELLCKIISPGMNVYPGHGEVYVA